ncbi:MAG: type II secretion system protein, partial [Patescibacteria group bacterium]|nr:type II secretion system protein [Patescibacteria group bacterium]
MLFTQRPPRARRAFTLVELLTVIVIIGILAGLVTAAAMRVRVSVRKAAIVLELKQIETAMSMYKDRFGEFPPDDLRSSNWSTIRRHLAKAFPRYRPTDWADFQADVLSEWKLDIKGYTYGETITFFLGGQPEWTSDVSTRLQNTGDI